MIETKGLTKVFEIKKGADITAVQDLTLSVPEGEVFGFLGPNGAGKTTTVRMLTSLIGPTSGQAWINGFQVGVNDQDIRRSVGILTESPGMYERLSASMNLEIYANLYDVEDVPGQVEKYLHMLGLWSRRDDPAGSFSKGMRQKLAIARALLHEPKVLFLDEPTSGLDPEAARLVRSFIEQLRGQGRTIFICTHNLNEADRLCDRIGIFKSHLIEVDTPENLREKLYGRKVVFHLRELDPVWVEGVKALSGVKDVQVVEQKLLVGMDDPESVNPRIIRWLVAAGADILFVGELRHSLEEVYIQTIQETGEAEVAA
ncbi:MAG: ABC transporter ATP-binding protein [Anaerolineaceae bacterium]|jgi:ABC-2 type transport system ATP-binding protein|nr:ABC transporter ATP-binding protein [Anaerolineaceae bacterium]